MKLRIKGNSIRLRLLRSEVERLAMHGAVSEEVNFGDSALQYSLVMSDNASEIHAAFLGDRVIITLPTRIARAWTKNDVVGITADQSIDAEGGTLSLLIEKDFECVGRPDDPDREDAYPNPSEVAV